MFDDPADLLRYHQMRIQALWRCRCQAHEPVSALRQFAHQSRFLTHAGIPYWAAVSDLLLTKLLPEMEAGADFAPLRLPLSAFRASSRGRPVQEARDHGRGRWPTLPRSP